jgi:hypothetical protein
MNSSGLNNIMPINDNLNEIKVQNMKEEMKSIINNTGSSSGRRKREKRKVGKKHKNVNEFTNKEEQKGIQNELKEQIKQFVIEEHNSNNNNENNNNNEIKVNENYSEKNKIDFKNEEKVKNIIFSLEKELDDLKQEYNSLLTKKNEIEEQSKTEKAILQEEYEKIIQEGKKKLSETEKELKILSDKCILTQQKLSDKNEELNKKTNEKLPLISPNIYTIILKKKIKALTWYLLILKNPKEKNMYSNYIWVAENQIKIKDFNENFEDSETQIKNQNVIYLKKLEEKEDIISKLKLKNEKLNEKLNNFTGTLKIPSSKLNDFKILNKDVLSTNSYYLNTNAEGESVPKHIYHRLLNQYNENNKAMNNLQKIYNETSKEITTLKSDLKKANEKLKQQNDFENNYSIIKKEDSLNFDDEDKEVVDQLTGEDVKIMNIKSEAINAEDEDAENLLNQQLILFKKQVREGEQIIQDLNDKLKNIKEQIILLIKNIKIDNKNKSFILEIGKILNFNDEEMKLINPPEKKGFSIFGKKK